MPRCAGTKRKGGQCTAIVTPPLEYCYAHDPAREGERKRNASRAGASKPNREILDLKKQLGEMIEEVLSGAVPTAPYAVANQLINTRLRAIELERKVKETEELEERVEALERADSESRGGRKWGA